MTTLREKLEQDPNYVIKDCQIVKEGRPQLEIDRGWHFIKACFDRKWEFDQDSGIWKWKDFIDRDNEIIDKELILDMVETYMEPGSDRMVLLDHRGERAGKIIAAWPQIVEVAEFYNYDITKSLGSGLDMIVKLNNPEPVDRGIQQTISVGMEIYLTD